MARIEGDYSEPERKRYTLQQHHEGLGQYQSFSDSFQNELERNEALQKQLEDGQVKALRLDGEGNPLFELVFSEIGERIGWLQLSQPYGGEKLLHVQTSIKEQDKGKVADSTRWKDGFYQNLGHIQADITPMAYAVSSVPNGLPETYRRKAALEHFTETLKKWGKWILLDPRE